MKYRDWMCNQGRYFDGYDIPREGPMNGPWERAVNAFDWFCGALLAGVCLGMLWRVFTGAA